MTSAIGTLLIRLAAKRCATRDQRHRAQLARACQMQQRLSKCRRQAEILDAAHQQEHPADEDKQ